MNPKRFTPRYTTFEIVKVKERIVKAARKQKRLRYKGPHKAINWFFSAKNLQARMEWHDILKVLNVKNLQPKIFYLATLTFRITGDIKKKTQRNKKSS